MKYAVCPTLIATLLLWSQAVSAQVAGGTNEKLMDMYVMGQIEKCADRAIKMTENDKTKYESEPYLYVAMCMVKIADDPELREFYPDAIKQALKYGAKFKKRDDRLKSKDKAYLFPENKEFIDELKEIAIREAKGYFVQDDYRKAVYYYKLGMKLEMEDPVMRMMKGVADLYNKNTKEGMLDVTYAMEKYEELAKAGDYEPNDYTIIAFEDGFVYYAKYLKEAGKVSEAQNVVKLARELAPKNKKFEQLQASIGG